MAILAEQVVNGLTLGSLYGLVALGLALLLGVVRFANFAHGELLMLGAYVLVGLRAGLGLPYGVAAPLAVVALGGVGFVLARTVGMTLLARSWRLQLVGTLAVTVLLESGIILVVGALPHTVPVALATRTVTLGGITLSRYRLLVFAVVALAFLGLRLLLGRARIGKAMRALAQNREAAVDLGIDVRQVATVTFVLAGALAGVAGVLFAPLYTVTPTMGAPVTFKALAAVVMAGAESTGAVFAAALLLGVAEALAGGFGLAADQEAQGVAVMARSRRARRPRVVRRSRAAGLLALVAAALAAPWLAPSSYAANTLVTLAIYVVLALAFDLMAGHIGAVSLATPAFYAIGAYTAGILATRHDAGLLLTLPAGTALAAAVAVAVGWPLFRLSDLAFAIGSLGLGLIAAALANNLTDLTGGAMCTTGIPSAELGLGPLRLSTATPRAAYGLAAVLAAAALLVYLGLTTYRAGRSIAMIQGDERLAAAFGVNPLRHKLTLFAASAGLTAAAGVFYAHYTTVVCPADFSPFLTINLLVMVFVGGPGSLGGVLLGTGLFVAVSEAVRGFAHLGNLLFGAVLLAAVLALPRGIWGWVNGLARRAGSRS